MMSKEPGEDRPQRVGGCPAIGLELAVEKSQVVHQSFGLGAVSAAALADIWGSTTTSGTFRENKAALRKFRLLEEVPGGGSGQHRLTKLAVTIILSVGPEHEEDRLRALQEAFLSPASYKDLWEKWGANLPQDSAIRIYLHRDRSFKHTSVDAIIRQYKSSMAFAGLDRPNGRLVPHSQPPAPSAVGELPPAPESRPMTARVPSVGVSEPSTLGSQCHIGVDPQVKGPSVELGWIELPVPLKDGVFFHWRIPGNRELTKSHFDQFKQFVDLVASARASD
jgi:hypothetical protein